MAICGGVYGGRLKACGERKMKEKVKDKDSERRASSKPPKNAPKSSTTWSWEDKESE
jgi:hypothetical protein